MSRVFAGVAATVLAAGLVRAQSFPPGYVDPAPLLAAAAKEIGEANLRCITYSGTGYDGAVGQTAEYNPNIDWPRIDALNNYTRTINWDTGTSKETFDRKPGLNPASWKVRARLARRHAIAEANTSDAHRQRHSGVVHRRGR